METIIEGSYEYWHDYINFNKINLMAKEKTDRRDTVEIYWYGRGRKSYGVRVVSSNGNKVAGCFGGYTKHSEALKEATKFMIGWSPTRFVDLTRPKEVNKKVSGRIY